MKIIYTLIINKEQENYISEYLYVCINHYQLVFHFID